MGMGPAGAQRKKVVVRCGLDAVGLASWSGVRLVELGTFELLQVLDLPMARAAARSASTASRSAVAYHQQVLDAICLPARMPAR